MQLPIFEKYIDELIEKSTLDVPAWNIEKAREGKAAGWNYIDGCMILALLEIYNATGEKKYYEFADAFIDHRVQEDGTITKYSVEEYNIDNVNAGKTLFALYALNGKEKYRKAIVHSRRIWNRNPLRPHYCPSHQQPYHIAANLRMEASHKGVVYISSTASCGVCATCQMAPCCTRMKFSSTACRSISSRGSK